MDNTLLSAIDARQTPQWGQYLNQIGWKYKQVDGTVVLIRPLTPLPWSMIKVQHPIGPVPLEKIDEIAKEYKAFLVVVEPHSFNYDKTQFTNCGYIKSLLRYAHTATIKIDLRRSENKLFDSFSENARRNIRKAQKNNLRVEVVDLNTEKNDHKFKTFFDLLVNLRNLKKFKTPDYEEYLKKMTAFKKTSYLLFAYEKSNPAPIAVVWLAHYNNVISYLQTGITNKGYDTMANYLLVWESLKLAQKLNLAVFDFETIFDPRYPKDHIGWKGYTNFKKRFHGEIISYPQSWIKIYNPLLKLFYICISTFTK